ncbi:MAG TPA: BTAD domain-containing putative transcriptional regulator [Patescibacteria group bacterium]|nr:BTAD domain-containing putative transcriptional regulator [Patescibacteria group bacterium]
MPDQPAIHLVDTPRAASVSFAPSDPVTFGPRGRTLTRAPIAVGPGHAVIAAPDRVRAEPGGGVSYPIQAGKIAAPGLRDETLARTRLLDWLDLKIHSRLIFVIADAGYGKTTLLADFSRRTRVRTIWYRLDEEDRDWIGFLSHLVAAGREFEPNFAPRTASILRALEPGGPTRDDAIETFLEELPSICLDGAALILDDFHLADEVADIRQIAREIVARGPERLSIVFASRRVPSIPVAKLRSLGELAEIGISDLRFSDAEMEQLFRETYGRPLEPDVLTELAKRTEGWAASLTLVQAALRERTPAETRSFVRGLSGARDELHDYLAEEVVGDLPAIQQQFLMRTSILQRVTPELAQVASGLSSVEVQSMVSDAERLGMLGRRASRRSPEQRYHPLVREFLEERLLRELGTDGVDALHVTVAEWAEPSDWRTAAHHYASARRWPDLLRVLESHLERIVASGAFSAASDFVRQFPDPPRSAAVEVIASRQASVDLDLERVLDHALHAVAIAPESDVGRANLITALFLSGRSAEALPMAEAFSRDAKSDLLRQVAHATTVLIRSSIDMDLTEVERVFILLAERSRVEGLSHFEGVSLLNAGLAMRSQGAFERAEAHAGNAIDCLAGSSSGNELAAAQFLKASVLAYRGNMDAARGIFLDAGRPMKHAARTEYLGEFADIEMQVGDAPAAEMLLSTIDDSTPHPISPLLGLVRVGMAIRNGLLTDATEEIAELESYAPTNYCGYVARIKSYQALIGTLRGDASASASAREAVGFSDKQNAGLWRELGTLCLASNAGHLDGAIRSLPPSVRCVLSIAAELVVGNLHQLSGDALAAVGAEALLRPGRWLPSIRLMAADSNHVSAPLGARLLSSVGVDSDVALLNRLGKIRRVHGADRHLGRTLARKLAAHVFVEDLGRVSISVGSTVIGGHEVRRKVLALLCFLVSRPRHSATRDEVLDAMWPDMDPAAAANSLNQSVYFLRRIFEPEYAEDTSAGYVHQDSELIWLDAELVSSRSQSCARLIADFERTGDPHFARLLSADYSAKFALDFSYEEWTVGFRDWLHVSYLRVIESEVRRAVDSRRVEEGIHLARRAVEIDPENEDLELSLLRLLRSSGAHSAAAEQYSHYAGLLRRDLGIEPPPLDAL